MDYKRDGVMSVSKDHGIKLFFPPFVDLEDRVVFAECELPPLFALLGAWDKGNVFDCGVERYDVRGIDLVG